ncbi:MAG: PIG-L deacetylase family protein [Actinomycetota bacterium]
MELLQPDDMPDRALVVVAHPDDIDFGVAGTAAVLTSSGCEVVYALCTSGEAGIPEDMDRDELKAIREREQRAAAAAVGVTDVRFLGMPDGHLEYNLDLRRVISRVIRQVKPNVVICQTPERNWDRIFSSHPDHLATANATIAAVYPDARNPHAHVELLAEGHEPHAVDWMWVMGGPEPNLAVDITAEFDRKVAALSSHESQVAWIEDIAGFLGNWARDTAKRHGLDDRAEYVELFKRVKTN